MIGSRLARGATRTVLGLILASTCTQAAVSQAIAEEYDPGMEVFDVVIDDGGVTEAQVEPVATDPTVIDGEFVQPTEEQVYDPEAEAARMAALAAAPAPPLAEAQGAAIVDGGGNILWQKNGDQRMSPASTTKVMTAVVALDALKNGISLDDQVSLVAPDLGPEAQMADYANGEQAVLRDMLRVMLVYSANDAAYNVARHVAGSIPAFADLMNAKAAEIGMTNSHFMNPHGIDEDGHYVCANDLARLSCYAMENYPFIAQTVGLHSVEIPLHGEKAVFQSTDVLLGTYNGIRGVKTGYAEAYTFAGASGRGSLQVYTAVLGCSTAEGRFNDTATLMDWAYSHFGERQISEDAWAVRVHPYALDFGYDVVISSANDARGTVWPDGGPASYESVLTRPGRLLVAETPYGWSSWNQGGRSMGQAVYATRSMPVRVSSWPVFTLPLFTDATMLGRSANNA